MIIYQTAKRECLTAHTLTCGATATNTVTVFAVYGIYRNYVFHRLRGLCSWLRVCHGEMSSLFLSGSNGTELRAFQICGFSWVSWQQDCGHEAHFWHSLPFAKIQRDFFLQYLIVINRPCFNFKLSVSLPNILLFYFWSWPLFCCFPVT